MLMTLCTSGVEFHKGQNQGNVLGRESLTFFFLGFEGGISKAEAVINATFLFLLLWKLLRLSMKKRLLFSDDKLSLGPSN